MDTIGEQAATAQPAPVEAVHGELGNIGNIGKIGVLKGPTTYTLAVNSLRITNTRSLFKDTDFVTASITVGTNAPQTKTVSLGNIDNGTHAVNIEFSGVLVGEGQNVVLSYAAVNAGHASQEKVISELTNAGTALANKAAQAAATAIGAAAGEALGTALGTAAVPIIGTALGALAGWVVGKLASLAFADCDGPVAAGVHIFTVADLQKGMSGSDFTPGVDSADGCGSNSQYYVNWSVSAQTH